VSPRTFSLTQSQLECDHDFTKTRRSSQGHMTSILGTPQCQKCAVEFDTLLRYFNIVARDCLHEYLWGNKGLYLDANRKRVTGKCKHCKLPVTGVLDVQSGEVSDVLAALGAGAYDGRSTVPVVVEGTPAEVSDLAKRFVPEGEPSVVGMEIERECVRMSMLTGIPTVFVGHTGIAKTMLLRRMHQEMEWPYHTIAGHAQVEVNTLIGKIWIREGEMNFRPGILPFCMKNGIAIGFQEINAVAPEVLIMLHEYLDEGKITITDLPPDHEWFTVKPHENFRLYGTMNPPEFYIGTRELSPALTRRCIIRRVEPLPEAQEIAVVTGQVENFDADTARKLVRVAQGMRKNVHENKATYFLSTADVVMWAKFAQRTEDVWRAADMAIFGKAPLEDVGLLENLIKTNCGMRRNGN
jgi:MoxR-like ATPase